MIVREVRPEEKDKYNSAVTHPLQSWEWGQFREKTGVKVVRLGVFNEQNLVSAFQVTFHNVPKTSYTVGYLPKCSLPDNFMIQSLKQIGQENRAIFIKLEPNVVSRTAQLEQFLFDNGCVFGRPLFTKYTFQINLEKTEEELLAAMKQKTRYNVRVAQKYGVQVVEDNSEQAFKDYLDLTFQTTKRQKFYSHDQDYHRQMWEILNPAGIAHLLKATFQNQTLVTWILFVFNNNLYYPYGASSSKNREVMASNLIMWEAMRFGKKMNCKIFDLWGSLGPQAKPSDPWFGFHRFKEGYSPTLVEFIGSFDLVINPTMYKLYNFADDLRWKWLKLKASLPF